MTGTSSILRHLVCWAMIIAIAGLAGCAGKKVMVKTDEGVIMQYRMPEGKAFRYEKSESSTQSMKMMGQAMETATEKTIAFTMESKGLKEDDLALTITIDSMNAGLQTPQGDFSADTEPVIGKSFDMKISSRGREMDLDAADALEYSLGMAGTRSLKADFATFLPDLPPDRVKIWDTWESQDTVNVEESGMNIQVISENLNVLEGFETLNGRECAKITADVVGSVTGEGMQGGANLTFDGQMNGKEVWYFDYVEGVFVKSSSDISVEATVMVSGPQEMTIPVTQTITLASDLID
jgi:hypothetical protein